MKKIYFSNQKKEEATHKPTASSSTIPFFTKPKQTVLPLQIWSIGFNKANFCLKMFKIYFPVLPYPPVPLWVLPNSSTSTKWIFGYGMITNCATRLPT